MESISFGAVYFRKTAPPSSDWEMDYQAAAQDGHTLFRHWFCWNAIETKRGVFDWNDYDKQLDLGIQYGIQTVIAEMSVDSPEWLNHELYGIGSIVDAHGKCQKSEMHTSSATGGHYCLCYDNLAVEEATNRFLKELALRYKDHPGLYGYDVFNECTLYSPDRLCYCQHTNKRFVEWLKAKYENIDQLAKAWGRYSLCDWEQIQLPAQMGPYAECVDAILFWNDNTFSNMQKKIAVLKQYDPNHKIIAHGNARSFNDIATCCGNDYKGSVLCDVFGYTYYHGTACNPFLAGDLIRSASDGKPFWRAEAIGNSDYQSRSAKQQPQLHKDLSSNPDYLRMDALISIVCGATAYMSPRWRPLLSGPLACSFGWYGLDGSPTKRSEEIRKLNEWCMQDNVLPLWNARPAKADAAIVLIDEAQIFSYLFGQYGNYHDYYNHTYSICVQGIHKAFLDSNIPCDIVQLNRIDEYKLVYLPYPLALSEHQVATLMDWVEKGGILITEGGFAYFDHHLKARLVMQSEQLCSFHGCQPLEMPLSPDRFNELKVCSDDGDFYGGVYRQSFDKVYGKILARYEDSSVACVQNQWGAGQVISIGTMPSYGYYHHNDNNTRLFIRKLYLNCMQMISVQTSAKGVFARIWEGNGEKYLWLLNPSADSIVTTVSINEKLLTFDTVQILRGTVLSDIATIQIETMDTAVIRL